MGINFTPVVVVLLIINVFFFLITGVFNIDLSLVLGLRYIQSEYFQPYQIFSHFFIHKEFWHLLSNMIGLIVFGPHLENLWGRNKFLVYYIICGLGGAIAWETMHHFDHKKLEEARVLFLEDPEPGQFAAFIREFRLQETASQELMEGFEKAYPDPQAIADYTGVINELYAYSIDANCIGASGAIFGLILGFGILFANMRMIVFPIPIPIKAMYLAIGYGLWELYKGVNPSPGDNVAHFAHLGGMLFGAVMIYFWHGRNR